MSLFDVTFWWLHNRLRRWAVGRREVSVLGKGLCRWLREDCWMLNSRLRRTWVKNYDVVWHGVYVVLIDDNCNVESRSTCSKPMIIIRHSPIRDAIKSTSSSLHFDTVNTTSSTFRFRYVLHAGHLWSGWNSSSLPSDDNTEKSEVYSLNCLARSINILFKIGISVFFGIWQSGICSFWDSQGQMKSNQERTTRC